MEITPLGELADSLTRDALEARVDLRAHTVFGGSGHVLGQTMVVLNAGAGLAEHGNPGDATVLVLRGRVRLASGEDFWDGGALDLLRVPDAPHTLDALEDSVVLLSMARYGA
jgi:quercetin dioxygenase-like cupin family protein